MPNPMPRDMLDKAMQIPEMLNAQSKPWAEVLAYHAVDRGEVSMSTAKKLIDSGFLDDNLALELVENIKEVVDGTVDYKARELADMEMSKSLAKEVAKLLNEPKALAIYLNRCSYKLSGKRLHEMILYELLRNPDWYATSMRPALYQAILHDSSLVNDDLIFESILKAKHENGVPAISTFGSILLTARRDETLKEMYDRSVLSPHSASFVSAADESGNSDLVLHFALVQALMGSIGSLVGHLSIESLGVLRDHFARFDLEDFDLESFLGPKLYEVHKDVIVEHEEDRSLTSRGKYLTGTVSTSVALQNISPSRKSVKILKKLDNEISGYEFAHSAEMWRKHFTTIANLDFSN